MHLQYCMQALHACSLTKQRAKKTMHTAVCECNKDLCFIQMGFTQN